MSRGDFADVLEVLSQHGHEIMKGINPDRCFDDPSGKKDYICYSCYEGSEFFMDLFGLEQYSIIAPDARSLPFIETRLPLEPGYVYHCELLTEKRQRDPEVDQVHYFTVVYGDRPLLLQTYGGVKGIGVKHVRGDISVILAAIRLLNRESYRRLFEIPAWGEKFLYFEETRFRYIRQPLWYPGLADLDRILSAYGLSFAREKMSYVI